MAKRYKFISLLALIALLMPPLALMASCSGAQSATGIDNQPADREVSALKLFEGDGFVLRYPISWEQQKVNGVTSLVNNANNLKLAIDTKFQKELDSIGYDITTDEGLTNIEPRCLNYYKAWIQDKGYDQVGKGESFAELNPSLSIASVAYNLQSSEKGTCYIVAIRERNVLLGFYSSEPEGVASVEAEALVIGILKGLE